MLHNEHQRALADANKVVGLEPGNALAFAQRSIIHHFMGDMQEALRDYAQALQIDPSFMMIACNAGEAAAARRNITQRLADYIDGIRSPARKPRTEHAAPDLPATSAAEQPATKDAEEQAEEFALQQLLAEEPAAATESAAPPAPVDVTSSLRKANAAAVATRTSIVREPATAKPNQVRPILKKRDVADRSVMQRWHKPLGIAATIAASLLLLLLISPLLRSSSRVRVCPVQGKAEYEGQPIASASIFLHPAWVKEPSFPRPRATVNDDGTFVVGTYGRDDGAPPGEYKVTVQWFTRTDPADEDSLPVNLLPPRYARADTSDVTVQIRDGENPSIAIKLP